MFVLDDAERMTLPTAQALLKTLEEPPPRTHLVLIIANPRALAADAPLALPASAVPAARATPTPRGSWKAAASRPPPARSWRGSRRGARASRSGRISTRSGPDGRRRSRWRRSPPARLGTALDGAPTDRATVATYLELYWAWYRDALCLAAGGSPALLVNADQEAALRALAARMPAPALAAALARVKAAWVALESNANPRLALETALLGLGGAAA